VLILAITKQPGSTRIGSPNGMSEYKIALFGSGGVGKSSLTGQFVSHTWTERYDPTIEDAFRKEFTVNGQECVLEILDTAGVEQFIAMRDHQMRDRHGFILVYDITNPSSMNDLNDLYTQIQQNKSPAAQSSIRDDNGDPEAVIPLVLVGNKLDLANERKVSHQRGKTLAERWNCAHYETSAKTRINVDEVFYDLVGQIMRENEEAVKAKKASVAMSPAPGQVGEKDDGDYVGTSCCVVT